IEDENLSVLDGYPEKKLFTRNPEGLCPSCRLFGTGAYKSRIRFGFATLKGDPGWLNPKGRKLTLPLLERPRPTWAVQHNDKENRGVPGRKFYVHHNGWETVNNGRHPSTGENIEPDLNNRTVEPLDKGNSFTFDIFFENLEHHELGILLWSLQLEKGLAHKLGMAKSAGFGSVEISLEGVSLRDKSGKWVNRDRAQADSWIEQGKKETVRRTEKETGEKTDKQGWDKSSHIENLKKLLYFPENQ
ncbi:MAG: hypothetical protein GY749_41510, partial [Desulfobacteraceae bacterium]|nr:hypothetical protein [Desulfobacteraceae bacterium]